MDELVYPANLVESRLLLSGLVETVQILANTVLFAKDRPVALQNDRFADNWVAYRVEFAKTTEQGFLFWFFTTQ